MKRYFNLKIDNVVETIDELDSSDFKTLKEFKIALKNLISEYRIAKMDVYRSQRCTKDWKNRD